MSDSSPIPRLISDRTRARELDDSNADICFVALSANNEPSVRTLILREVSDEGLTVFINRTSDKWQIYQQNNAASILLWYPSIQRQYRVTGQLIELDRAAVEQNWPRKPVASKYLDYAYDSLARQGAIVESYEQIVTHITELKKKRDESTLTTPDSATAFQLRTQTIELLDLNQPERIHDRKLFTRDGEFWSMQQLMP